jgi:predicted small lipoprotein YifL
VRLQPYFLLLLLVPLMLAGCGQKGGLYIPQEAPPPKPAEQESSE